jgi:HemY protein
MSSKIFKLFFFLSLGVLIGYLIHIDPGYILLDYNHYSLETSLWFGLTCLLILFIIGHFTLRLLNLTFNINKKIAKRKNLSHLKKHRNSLDTGLKYLAEGKWEKAKEKFIAGAKYHTDPTANYIGALKVAQAKGGGDIDNIIPEDESSTIINENLEIDLTKAKLFILSTQWDKAQTILEKSMQQHAKHPYVIKLLATTYQNQHDWGKIETLLPTIKKTKALTKDDLLQLKINLAKHKLLQAKTSAEELQQTWKNQSSDIRNDANTVACYCELLCSHNLTELAQNILEKKLKKSWHKSLLICYGNIAKQNAIEPLMRAEKWLKDHPDDAGLLLCLGTLSIKNQMQPKAEQYFKHAFKIEPTKATLLQLANLCELNNKPLESINYLKKYIAIQ